MVLVVVAVENRFAGDRLADEVFVVRGPKLDQVEESVSSRLEEVC